jgi:DsbE subfamily thiol:disulfide oxidoreductase
MKSKAFILIALLIGGLAAVILLAKTSDSPPPPKATIGLPAPAFELRDTEGRTWKLSDLKGKVVFVNFWASWCTTCDLENPSIQNLINVYRGNDKLVVLSILFRDDPQKALDYLRRKGFTFTVLLDSGTAASEYGLTGVPETYIIDRKGILAHKIIGPSQWDSPEVIANLKKLMSEG